MFHCFHKKICFEFVSVKVLVQGVNTMNESLYYTTYSSYLKKRYGEKVYKLPINLPVSCPNRMEGNTGCIFCSEVGTGFEAMENTCSITKQLQETKDKIEKKYKAHKFIAYFQNYTNTFLPLSQFQIAMEEAALFPDLVEISISTRPDCIHEDYLCYLQELKERTGIQIHIELGLQTVNYHTLHKINRGHGLAEFLDAVLRIFAHSFTICTHMILNLPYDTEEDALESARFLSALPIQIVKFHSLYIPENTVLYNEYKNGKIALCTKEEYLQRLAGCISLLREDIAIERLFSRVPKEYAIFSNWDTSWWKLKDEFLELMEEKQYIQGCRCHYLNGSALRKWRLHDVE